MKLICFLALLVLSVSVLFISCKKTTQIGANVLPTSDFINAISTDTFTVLTQEEAEFPVPTTGLTNYLLGSMKDPVFGTSYAAIFTQVQLPGFSGSYAWSDSTIVDSMVLSLPFWTAPPYYGFQNIPQTINVYQVTQSMALGTTYYSNQAFSFNPTPIGTKRFLPNVNSYSIDSPSVLGIKYAPQLRIKLSNAFVQELMSQTSNGTTGNGTFSSNSAFQNFLKGLLIAPDTTIGFGGGMMYFDMTYAYIYVYGKIGKVESKVDTSINFATFNINSSVGVTTNYDKHNYTGTAIPSLLKSDSASNSVLYLQSMGGLRVRVTIPYLKNLGSNILINKAELEMVQTYDPANNDETCFIPPTTVEVVNDSLNYDYAIEDQNNPFLVYGGTELLVPYANNTNDSLAEYTVSIADQVQYMLTGKNPYGSTINYSQFNSFFLLTSPNPEIASRIVLGGNNPKMIGGNNPKSSKLVLHLIYTKLNN